MRHQKAGRESKALVVKRFSLLQKMAAMYIKLNALEVVVLLRPVLPYQLNIRLSLKKSQSLLMTQNCIPKFVIQVIQKHSLLFSLQYL